MSGWRALPIDADQAVVYPVADLMDHQPDDCPCGPTTKPVKRGDGSVGWVHVHHALDGRERQERTGDA